MKKFFSFVAALVLSLSAVQAQVNVLTAPAASISKAPGAVRPETPRKAPSKIQLADNQLLLGGYTSDAYASPGEGVGLYRYPGTLRAAIELDAANFTVFDGGQVVKIRVALANSATVSRVFLSAVTDSRAVTDLVSQNVNFNSTGWTEIELESPVTLNFSEFEELLLGFDYVQTSSQSSYGSFPLSFVADGSEVYPTFIFGNLGQGTGWYNIGAEDYGNLSIQAVVEGDFMGNSAKPKELGNILIPFGESVTRQFAVGNTGKGTLQSLDYVLSIDGEDQPEQHATLNGAAFGQTDYAEVIFPSADTEKTQTYSITVTKVNGETNNETANVVSGLMASTSKKLVQRVVIEEFTGTGCGWCPRGLVGMEKLRNAYGDLFVGIGIHQYNNSDAMYIDQNSYANLGFTGAPSCAVQRRGIIDPYYGSLDDNFGIAQDFEAVSSAPAFASVDAEALWNEDSTKVVAKASVDAILDGADYELEFVLIADSLSGTGAAWNQSNYYAQYTLAQVGSDDLAPFCRGGNYGQSTVAGLKFNDVALASSYVGGSNQVEPIENISSTEGIVREYTLSLPTKTALRNAIKPNLVFVAALLIDPIDGTIVNAVKVPVTEYIDPTTTGITTAASTSEEPCRYSLDGRQLAAPQKGLNIIRMANGETRKVIIH